MRNTYEGSFIAYVFILVACAVGLVVMAFRFRDHEAIESRCLAYFRDTFQGYDTAPEVCTHIVTGKPIAPYQFGQESFSPSSK